MMKTTKQFLPVMVAAMITTITCNTSFAQANKTTTNDREEKNANDDSRNHKQANNMQIDDNDAILLKDGYVVKDEKVMVISNGKITKLTKEITFKDGSKLTTNAVLVKRDGEKQTLKDGDFLNKDGEVKSRGAMTKDCLMMKDGKMTITRNGKTMPMDKDITMKNGTVCTVNGVCTTKSGKKSTLKNGECVDLNGQMLNSGNQTMNK